jgi:gamma-glutamyltranspeptidase/glutathione hydrolase
MPWPTHQKMEIIILCIWALMATFALAATQIALSSLTSTRLEEGKLGAVASESKICSQIGIELLKAGGNAADALVGTSACVGVIGMYHSGIGGGGFMLVRSSNGSYEVIDFRETAPAAAHEDMFLNNTLGSVFGGLAR